MQSEFCKEPIIIIMFCLFSFHCIFLSAITNGESDLCIDEAPSVLDLVNIYLFLLLLLLLL
jgi:hypothetical protein